MRERKDMELSAQETGKELGRTGREETHDQNIWYEKYF